MRVEDESSKFGNILFAEEGGIWRRTLIPTLGLIFGFFVLGATFFVSITQLDTEEWWVLLLIAVIIIFIEIVILFPMSFGKRFVVYERGFTPPRRSIGYLLKGNAKVIDFSNVVSVIISPKTKNPPQKITCFINLTKKRRLMLTHLDVGDKGVKVFLNQLKKIKPSVLKEWKGRLEYFIEKEVA